MNNRAGFQPWSVQAPTRLLPGEVAVSTCLCLFRLLLQKYIDWVAYRQQKLFLKVWEGGNPFFFNLENNLILFEGVGRCPAAELLELLLGV